MAPSVACGTAASLLTQAGRLLSRAADVTEGHMLFKTLAVDGHQHFHCLWFQNQKVESKDQMRLFSGLGNMTAVGMRNDFRRHLLAVLGGSPGEMFAAAQELPDGASYSDFLPAIKGSILVSLA